MLPEVKKWQWSHLFIQLLFVLPQVKKCIPAGECLFQAAEISLPMSVPFWKQEFLHLWAFVCPDTRLENPPTVHLPSHLFIQLLFLLCCLKSRSGSGHTCSSNCCFSSVASNQEVTVVTLVFPTVWMVLYMDLLHVLNYSCLPSPFIYVCRSYSARSSSSSCLPSVSRGSSSSCSLSDHAVRQRGRWF